MSNDEQIYINSYIVVGCVFIACAPLVGVIGLAAPIAAPFCYTTATAIASTGMGMIMNGLCDDNNKNRKNLFFLCVDKFNKAGTKEEAKRIYISPSQFSSTPEGVFVDIEEMPYLISIDSLSYDDLDFTIMINDSEYQ
ncbi:hypothetical protein [Parachlamydia acanthamoebae]|jgi:hypothetical protein|uniref:hypothetical protein n=1 Tax=Parachlamydia acanthamoebae TaxID=83552 RepID=UPI0024E26C19|nr:hypothetical protein [Parachlamydia acanthamoebae]